MTFSFKRCAFMRIEVFNKMMRMRVFTVAALGAMLAIPNTSLARDEYGGFKTKQNYNLSGRQQRQPPRGGAATWQTFIASQQVIRPMLDQNSAQHIRNAIARYDRIVRAGGWPVLPGNVTLKKGSRNRYVASLRQRLALTGDLYNVQGDQHYFDERVHQAVRLFQYRHGLLTDGEVGPATIRALNISARSKLRTLQINLGRLGDAPKALGNRYVVVNIPGAELEAVQNGRVYSRHVIVVGKKDRQSPPLNSTIAQLNFYPYWTPPESIIRRDLIPKAAKNPNYFHQINMKVYDPQNGGAEVDPVLVNWSQTSSRRYSMRQEPGPQNAMATVKINFPNRHAVYMHDTPSKSLFKHNFRYHSSGCVRIDAPHILTEWILRGQSGWSARAIRDVVAAKQRVDVSISRKVPVRWVYFTGWANADGLTFFRQDVYRQDR